MRPFRLTLSAVGSALLLLFPLAVWLRRMLEIYVQPDIRAFMADTYVYYSSALAWAQGQNPYVLRYVYPPLTLPFFGLFTGVPYEQFYHGFLLLNGLAGLFLVWLWRRHFDCKAVFFFLFVLLAFYKTMDVDLVCGNITIYEGVLLFLGFLAFLRRRFAVFTALVVAASLFKLVPILFLGLLIFSRERRWYVYLLSGLLAFGCFVGLNFLFYPSLTQEFFRQATDRNLEDGGMAPSMRTAIKFLLEYFSQRFPGLAAWTVPVYAVVAALVSGVSLLALRKFYLRGDSRGQLPIVLFSTVVFLLVLPRVKDYSYVIVIPAAYYFMERLMEKSRQYFWPFFLVAILSPAAIDLPFLFFAVKFVKLHFCWIFLFVVWACTVPMLWQGPAKDGSHPLFT